MNNQHNDHEVPDQGAEELDNDSNDYDELMIDLLEIMDEIDFADNDTPAMEEESDD